MNGAKPIVSVERYILDLWNGGKSMKEIGKELGLKWWKVNRTIVFARRFDPSVRTTKSGRPFHKKVVQNDRS